MPGKHARELQVFIVPRDQPAGPLRPAQTRTVEARTKDGLVDEAKRSLVAEGYSQVRAVSFTPDGMVAYVVEAS